MCSLRLYHWVVSHDCSKMLLHPLQRLLQPFKIEQAAHKSKVGQPKRAEDSRPLPAQSPVLLVLDEFPRAEKIQAGRESQTPEHDQSCGRCGGNLPVTKLGTRRRRHADQDKEQQTEVDDLDEDSLHDLAGTMQLKTEFRTNAEAQRTRSAAEF